MCVADSSVLQVHLLPNYRAARPLAALKNVILFVAEYDSTP